MNKDMIRITTAIAVGATVGGFIARLMNPNIWFVGVLIGALLAYLSFCWKDVGLAVKNTAWEMFVIKNPGQFKLVFAEGWSITVGLMATMSTMYFHLAVIAFVISLRYPAAFTRINLLIDGAIVVTIILMFAIGLLKGLAGALYATTAKNPRNADDIRKNTLQIWEQAKGDFLPNALRKEFRGLVWLIVHIPHGCKLAVLFFKTVFITIHSEMRLICGIDTAIGISVGYWLGHSAVYVIVGTAIGVLVGLLNYYVVSIRWLKLKPV